ncbi:Hybrid signal transduction protein dokA [Elsinoe australis]|uniref:histidine kinase n=1 Tax=Elsinoe australis TaxID=40998 RepID=A0A2P7YKV0_9PEZI|nr:Hybrid signal transduction protein dokA [Elsinoe australis]
MMHKSRAEARATSLQEQEVHQYYQPWLAAHGSASNVATNLDSIDASNLQEQGYRARASRDRTLTALAQLATLRLNVRRAMVSLIDPDYQYILTEATKTISLSTDDHHESDDALWLGNTILRRDDAVCHYCLMGTYAVEDKNKGKYEGRGFVVNDCRMDDRFKHRPYVQEEPGVRFYAGVPIVTRAGRAIGAYAVSDEHPRNGLTLDEFKFMEDTAATVVEHLEWARDRVDRFKGERIVRGLAGFIESSSSSRTASTTHRRFDSRNIGTAQNDTTTEDPEPRESQHSNSSKSSQVSGPRQHSRSGEINNQHTPEQSEDDRPTHLTPRRVAKKSSQVLRHSQSKSTINESEPDSEDSIGSTHSRLSRRGQAADSSGATAIASIMSRAAYIMRKSTLADGMIFYGCSKEFGEIDTLQPVPEQVETGSGPEVDDGYGADTCSVLGTSHAIHPQPLRIATLSKYLHAFPEGKILHFTSQGYGMEPADDSTSESPGTLSSKEPAHVRRDAKPQSRRKRKSRLSHQEILRNAPGMRTMIFLPVRDLVNNRWLAGGFLWTTKAGRVMNLGQDFSYLRAFANSICSEVSRTNVERLDYAKTTFIASMSHELRSPLHGILGSVEFLQDTVTDAYQSGLVQTISNCSRTLLDTLSNLLTYAKVTTIDTIGAGTESVDLGQLVEEVVEAVCAGHSFKKLHSKKLHEEVHTTLADTLVTAAKLSASRLYSDDDGEDNGTLSKGALCVLLDIAPSLSWNVSTNPGALRRILINLVGNALKYTSTGFVAVSLRAKEDGDKIDTTLRVIDTGRGISEGFQRDHLFVPFKQEDTFASGTGLGLSIVKQLVDSLNGQIRVRSTVGQGTEMEVTFRLVQGYKGIDLPEDDMLDVAAKTKGLRLCVLDPNQEKQRPGKDHIARLDTTLSETCATWFGMEITSADNMTEANTDIFLYTEPPSLEYLLEHHGGEEAEQPHPLIIVCMNASEAISVSRSLLNHSELGNIVEVIAQPCGPRKMAKVLVHCLKAVTERGIKESLKSRSSQHLGADQSIVKQDTSLQQATQAPSAHNPAALSGSEDRLQEQKERSVAVSEAVQLPEPSPQSGHLAAPPMSPRIASSRALEMRPKQDASELDASNPRVLLVDDNKVNVDLLVRFVQKFKMPHEAAYNGQEALDAFSKANQGSGRRFDYILMDISMPVMDGIEATRRIRAFEEENRIARTTIIALSAFASADTQAAAKAQGVDTYLTKPVKFAQLQSLLLNNT